MLSLRKELVRKGKEGLIDRKGVQMLERKDIEMIRDVVEEAMGSLKEDVTELKGDVTVLKEDVTKLKGDIEDLKQVTEKTQNDVIKINLTLENIVMPRLCTIEDCYTSTYHRYAEGIGQLETMQMDIDILKETATQHGEMLQRLA